MRSRLSSTTVSIITDFNNGLREQELFAKYSPASINKAIVEISSTNFGQYRHVLNYLRLIQPPLIKNRHHVPRSSPSHLVADADVVVYDDATNDYLVWDEETLSPLIWNE